MALNKPTSPPKSFKKTTSKVNLDDLNLSGSNNDDENKDDGTTIYASGAIASQNTDLQDKAIIPHNARRRARTHHTNILDTSTNDSSNDNNNNNNNNNNQCDDTKDDSKENATNVYASGAIQQETQIENKPIIQNARRRARSHYVATSYTKETEAIFTVKDGSELKSVDQVSATMKKPLNARKRAKSRGKNKDIIPTTK